MFKQSWKQYISEVTGKEKKMSLMIFTSIHLPKFTQNSQSQKSIPAQRSICILLPRDSGLSTHPNNGPACLSLVIRVFIVDQKS